MTTFLVPPQKCLALKARAHSYESSSVVNPSKAATKEPLYEIRGVFPGTLLSSRGLTPEENCRFEDNVPLAGYTCVAIVKNRCLMRSPQGELFYISKDNYVDITMWALNHNQTIAQTVLQWVLELGNQDHVLIPYEAIANSTLTAPFLTFLEMENNKQYYDAIYKESVMKMAFNHEYDYLVVPGAGSKSTIHRSILIAKNGEVVYTGKVHPEGPLNISGLFMSELKQPIQNPFGILSPEDALFIADPVLRYCSEFLDNMDRIRHATPSISNLCQTVGIEDLTEEQVSRLVVKYTASPEGGSALRINKEEMLNNVMSADITKITVKLLISLPAKEALSTPHFEAKHFTITRDNANQHFVINMVNSRGQRYFQLNVPIEDAPIGRRLMLEGIRLYLRENPRYQVHLVV